MNDPSIDTLVRRFAGFLACSWDVVDALARQFPVPSLMEDWKQANWEMLVESFFWKGAVFLVVYGGGADTDSLSSRVSRTERLASHRVMCVPVGEDVRDLLSGRRVRL